MSWITPEFEVIELSSRTDLDLGRYEQHTIEVIVDRLVRRDGIRQRLTESMETALRLAEGIAEISIMVDEGEEDDVAAFIGEVPPAFGEGPVEIALADTPHRVFAGGKRHVWRLKRSHKTLPDLRGSFVRFFGALVHKVTDHALIVRLACSPDKGRVGGPQARGQATAARTCCANQSRPGSGRPALRTDEMVKGARSNGASSTCRFNSPAIRSPSRVGHEAMASVDDLRAEGPQR